MKALLEVYKMSGSKIFFVYTKLLCIINLCVIHKLFTKSNPKYAYKEESNKILFI